MQALKIHRSIVEWLRSKHVTKTGHFCIHQPSGITTRLVLFSPVALVSILKISSIEYLPPSHTQRVGAGCRGGTNSFARKEKLVAMHFKVYSTNFFYLKS